jgi:outer membrane protein TolC
MMTFHSRTWVALLAALWLAACSTTRVDPPAPVAPAATQFKEAGPWQPAATTEALPDDWWWTIFKDPVLDDLVSRLVVGNESLKSLVAARPADKVG